MLGRLVFALLQFPIGFILRLLSAAQRELLHLHFSFFQNSFVSGRWLRVEGTSGVHISSHLKRLDLELGFGLLRVAGVARCLVRIPSPRPRIVFAPVGAILSVVIVTDSFFGSVLWESTFRRTSGSTGCTKLC